MTKSRYRWLINPMILFLSATCNSTAMQGGGQCQAGQDSDGDGLTDDIECRIGSDPNNPDTNGDGLSDGDAYNLGLDPTKLDTDGDGVPDVTELKYPKICVATDRNAQRRPPMSCTATSDCQAGETCNGLDPTKADSDGDGVPDDEEDVTLDGVIDFAGGETDPRLYDTDGDGQSDANSGSRICRPDGLATVVRHPLGGIQLGHDPIYGTAKDISGVTMNRNGAVVDDASSGVAGLVAVENTTLGDVRADSQSYETAIQTLLTASKFVGVFVGRPFTTHEQLAAIHSTYLYTAAAATSSSAVRDSVVATLTGGTAPGGGTAGASNTTFYVDVTTVRRTTALDDLIVVVTPQTQYNDTTQPTGIRADDLSNASGVAEGNQDLDHVCQGVIASRLPTADFLWTVDISASMDDNQVLVGNAAATFAQKLTSAGVDYRVGMFAAEGNVANPITLSMAYTTGVAAVDNTTTFPTDGWKNGFAMLQGSTANIDHWLCRYVTATSSGANGYCPTDGNKTVDPYWPFGINNGSDAREEPAAAAVRINDIFKKNASNGTTNPDWKWRDNATKVAFLITDEPGGMGGGSSSNDYNRYFCSQNNPDTGQRWAPNGAKCNLDSSLTGTGLDATALNGIVSYFQNNQLLTYGMVPVFNRTCLPTPAIEDLPRCIIEGNGGAYLNIQSATQAQVSAAMDRIAADVIGASSPIVLSRSPITSTIKVTLRGNDVPRSRSNGFDYNQNSKSIVFYGNTYRPSLGDTVYVSYRVWTGSLG